MVAKKNRSAHRGGSHGSHQVPLGGVQGAEYLGAPRRAIENKSRCLRDEGIQSGKSHGQKDRLAARQNELQNVKLYDR